MNLFENDINYIKHEIWKPKQRPQNKTPKSPWKNTKINRNKQMGKL